MMSNFRTRLRRRDLLIGPLVTLGSPEVADLFALAGCDWVWLDLEHAPLDPARVLAHVQAVGGRCGTIVRVPWNDPVEIKKVLDVGCDGILVPQVRSGDEAARAVAAAKYPPAGVRSVGIARAQNYGMTLADYVRTANDSVAVILQVEHIDAVPKIDEILAVPGVDAILIGPYDLSASLGRPGDLGHPDVQAAIRTISTKCNEHGMPWGAFSPDAASAKIQIERGATLLAVATDTMYLWKGMKVVLSELRS